MWHKQSVRILQQQRTDSSATAARLHWTFFSQYFAIYILLILPWLCGTHPVMRNKLGTQLQVEKRLVVPSTSDDAGLPNSRAVAPTVTTIYWPNGVIPYTFVYQGLSDHELGNYISNVREAMDWWQTSTCVQFIEVNTTTYNGTQTLPISLQKRNTKCTAYIGYTQRFIMDLDEECLLDVGNLAHELGHIIGLIHEHVRYDRDNYIKVNFSNILQESSVTYKTFDEGFTYVSTPYDFDSIMHYAPKNGDALNLDLPIFWLRNGVNFTGTIGQRECLSFYDILATRGLYNCWETPKPHITDCNYHPLTINGSIVLNAPELDKSGSGASESTQSESGEWELTQSGSGQSESCIPESTQSGSESGTGVPQSTTPSVPDPTPNVPHPTHSEPSVPDPTEGGSDMPRPTECDLSVVTNPILNTKFFYPGDVVAFKSVLSPLNRWIGCPEDQKCYAWGCPGSKFNTSNVYCPHYEFIVSPGGLCTPSSPPSSSSSPSSSSAYYALRSGVIVLLQQRACSNSISYYSPLYCGVDEEQCSIRINSTCMTSHWQQHTTAANCTYQKFRIISLDRDIGRRLRYKDKVRLEDYGNPALSLACDVQNKRKRKRTCLLQVYNRETSQHTDHHFIIYKVNRQF